MASRRETNGGRYQDGRQPPAPESTGPTPAAAAAAAGATAAGQRTTTAPVREAMTTAPPTSPLASPIGEVAAPDARLRGAHFPTERLFRTPPAPPDSVMRRLVFKATGGRLNLGPSGAEEARQQLINRVRTPITTGRRCLASLSLKGGVGKTTTTVMLGHTLAAYRGDNVIAVDANPDAGNLADRVHRQTPFGARDLLAAGPLERYADLRPFTSQAESRLQVLAGDSDPGLSEPFSAYDYHSVLTALERFYSVILTDCGTGVLHDAMRAVLWYADQLVVVTTPSVDSAKALKQLLDWLDQHDHQDLRAASVLVVNGERKDSRVSVSEFVSYFGPRVRSVIGIPYDPVLATGGECELTDLDPKTQRAYLELAAVVAEGFTNGAPTTAGAAAAGTAAPGPAVAGTAAAGTAAGAGAAPPQGR